MNIMIIIPSLSGGGAERVATVLASGLSKEHNVLLVTYKEVNDPYLVDVDVKCICLKCSDGKNALSRLFNSVKRINKLQKIKAEYSIECSISLLFSPNIENVLSKHNEKTIVSLRSKYSVNYHGIKGFINKYTCQKADLAVALSKNVMYDQIHNYSTPLDKIITIYNPCDIEQIQKMSCEPISNTLFNSLKRQGKTIIITAGRLTEQKGQWHLIRSFSIVAKQFRDAVLIILGEGPLNDYLKKLVDDLNLNNKVFLLGFYKNPYPFLKKSDIFAFTSLFEGFGNILLEAMACDLPLVCCDCDAGPRELIAPNTDPRVFANGIEMEENGILTKVMDGVKYNGDDLLTKEEKEYAEALCKLIGDKGLREYYANQSKRRIRDFNKERIIEEWKSIIKQ